MKAVFALFALLAVVAARPAEDKKYPLRLQPELDNIDVEEYLKNDKLVDLQLKCVVYDGPCDAVGRWIKPRVAAGLLGNCLECTPKQAKDMQKILAFLQEKRPEAYRTSVVKYLKDSGIKVDEGSSTAASA